MNIFDVERRLNELEARLGRIEQHLQLRAGQEPEVEIDAIVPPPAAGSHVVHPPPLPSVVAPVEPLIASVTPPPIAAVIPPPVMAPFVAPPIIASESSPETLAPVNPPPPLAARSMPIAPLSEQPAPMIALPSREPHRALEQTIGLKWAGWVGAVVLVIGASLGVKFAYDQGWLHGLPPAVRLGLIALAGLGLIAIGEYVYRKVNVISAASLYGAGVATLFLASYVGHTYYALYDSSTAFALMGLTVFAGAGVAMRGGMVSIAVLSLIGGNLAPILVTTDNPHLIPFLSYLLVLQTVALVLSLWGATAKWWTLRGFSLTTTAGWAAIVLLNQSMVRQSFGAALIFVLASSVGFQAEMIAAIFRRARLQRDISTGQPAPPKAPAVGATFSMIVTALATLAICWMFRDSLPTVRAAWVVALSLACAITGRWLLQWPQRRALAVSFAMQAAALLVLAIPMALSGAWIIVGWGVLAMAFVGVGVILNVQTPRVAGVVTWLLAMADLVRWANDPGTSATASVTWLTLIGAAVPAYAILGWIMTLLGQAIAWLLYVPDTRAEGKTDGRPQWNMVAWGISILAGVAWVAVALAALPPLGATLAIILYAWLLAAADMATRRLSFAFQAAGVLALAACKWALIDVVGQRMSPGWSALRYAPVLNPVMGMATLLALSIAALYLLRRKSMRAMLGGSVNEAGFVLDVAATLIVLVSVGFAAEIDRIVERAVVQGLKLAWPPGQLKELLWTMLGTLAVAMLAAVVRKVEKLSPPTGWPVRLNALMGFLAMKFFVFDTVFYALMDERGTLAPALLLNAQMIAGLVLAAGIVFLGWATARDRQARIPANGARLAAAVVLWAGTFEVQRQAFIWAGTGPWPAWHLTLMLWTILWTLGALILMSVAPRLDPSPEARKLPAGIIIALAVKYLIVDTLFWRIDVGVALAPALFNIQALTAAVVLIALALLRRSTTDDGPLAGLHHAAGRIAMLVVLWAGLLEIDRVFEHMAMARTVFADPRLAKQVAFSIFCSVYAVVCVTAGFALRKASMRYFGLALFGLTLLKVTFVDLGQVGAGYRILSFLGLGALLLGTSVLYGKLSPILLGEIKPSV